MSEYIKKEDAIQALHEATPARSVSDTNWNDMVVDLVVRTATDNLNNLPTIQTDEDCISRSALLQEIDKVLAHANKMWDSERAAIEADRARIGRQPTVAPTATIADSQETATYIQALKNRIKELEEEQDEDYIDAVSSVGYDHGFEDGYSKGKAERRHGEWVAERKNQGGFTPGGNSVMSCSCCGWIYGAHRIVPDYNFCPNCGADMREVE